VVSGIDIALWDIRGKALGRPVYELLGGAVRPAIPLYTHFPLGDTPEAAARNALEPVRDGHRAIKTDPFAPERERRRRRGLPDAYLDGGMSAAGEQEGADVIAAIREAVGPEVELLIDAHALYNVPTAVRLATRLAPHRITWFEEPVPPESYHALKQVRDQAPVPICVGERLHTRFEFVPVFEGRLADFVMPDVTWTGGISELKKIATMAEAYSVPVSPHDASGPINVLAGLHRDAARRVRGRAACPPAARVGPRDEPGLPEGQRGPGLGSLSAPSPAAPRRRRGLGPVAHPTPNGRDSGDGHAAQPPAGGREGLPARPSPRIPARRTGSVAPPTSLLLAPRRTLPRAAAVGELVAHDLAVVAIDHRGQVRPAVGGCGGPLARRPRPR
jgi:L-alanine-DL-glutamate epimerase-like enolase superfamily enzyme